MRGHARTERLNLHDLAADVVAGTATLRVGASPDACDRDLADLN